MKSCPLVRKSRPCKASTPLRRDTVVNLLFYLCDPLPDACSTPPFTDGPAILILTLLCSNVRNCQRPSTALRALDLFLALSPYLTDETKLDRVLPYMVGLTSNDSASVRAAALRALTECVSTTIHLGAVDWTVTSHLCPTHAELLSVALSSRESRR